jgi:hypothetical protein
MRRAAVPFTEFAGSCTTDAAFNSGFAFAFAWDGLAAAAAAEAPRPRKLLSVVAVCCRHAAAADKVAAIQEPNLHRMPRTKAIRFYVHGLPCVRSSQTDRVDCGSERTCFASTPVVGREAVLQAHDGTAVLACVCVGRPQLLLAVLHRATWLLVHFSIVFRRALSLLQASDLNLQKRY